MKGGSSKGSTSKGSTRKGGSKAAASSAPQQVFRTASESKVGSDIAGIERHGMTESLPCATTKQMIDDLAFDGVTPLTGAELDGLCERLTTWIEEYRYEQNQPPSSSYWNLFKEIDNDGDHEITFDELTTCVRRELKKGPRTLSHTELKRLWVHLDANADNQVELSPCLTHCARVQPPLLLFTVTNRLPMYALYMHSAPTR